MTRRLLIGLAVLAALVAIAYGGHAWWYSLSHVSTDDAYVEGTIAAISAKVMGHVTELLVEDNKPVKVGDLLVRVDRRDYEARRDQAKAAVAVAAASFEAVRSETQLARETTAAQAQ